MDRQDYQDRKGPKAGAEFNAASSVSAKEIPRVSEAISFYWEDRRIVRRLAPDDNEIKVLRERNGNSEDT